MGSIPESGRSPGEGNGNPLQYSCLENLMDRRAWLATVHGVAKSQTWLSTHTHMYTTPSFIHLSANTYLGCFHVLVIENSAAMNNEEHRSV